MLALNYFVDFVAVVKGIKLDFMDLYVFVSLYNYFNIEAISFISE